jgi:multiple sugar transport system substrate-binding protein
VAGLLLLALWLGDAPAQQVLTVAAFPAVDDIVRAAIPRWKRLHPNVDIKVVSRQFNDHHTALMTALSTSFFAVSDVHSL